MAPHGRSLLYEQLWAILIFFQMSIIYTMALVTGEQRRPPSPPPSPPPAKKRKHRMWIRPWIEQRDEKGAYNNPMADLYTLDTSAFRNYTRITPEFFELLTSRVEPHLRKRGCNFREPLSPGMKLAITL